MKKAKTLLGVLAFGAALAVATPTMAQTDDTNAAMTTTAVDHDDDDDDNGNWGLAGLLGLLGLLGLRKKNEVVHHNTTTHPNR
ncbi:WGxxGxxG family protein [Hymenobacter sp. B81]|uniref:WGxxGxxG family protein n=1 Tax=Hymenobacter sp. B81 TaxID=3344878 RepID=UPI0037DDA49C